MVLEGTIYFGRQWGAQDFGDAEKGLVVMVTVDRKAKQTQHVINLMHTHEMLVDRKLEK
jgi:hypothetical protein